MDADVIVVGAGNAAMCAALSAHENGAKVIVLEAAPIEERGGNSTYTAGAMRFVFENPGHCLEVLGELSETELANIDFGTYTADQYYDDMGRLTQFKCDPDMTEILVTKSRETLVWMRSKGVKFQPSFGRQAFKVGGKFKFWGGLSCEVWGGGPGLIDALHKRAETDKIPVRYETRLVQLLTEDGRITGVVAEHDGKRFPLTSKAVVLACGGFESNAEMRCRYLGPNWDLAKVRGTRFNMGEGINAALSIGAASHGHWSGCHAVAWDLNAPEFGDLTVGDNFQKHSYPLGIVVNARGERFLDEGADFRNYTYAKYGGIILQQPNMMAWQVFDSKVVSMLRDEYRIRRITKASANTIEELATKLEGVDPKRFVETVKAFNAAVQTDVAFNPNVKDGRGTKGLAVPKSNWANPLDTPPYEAFAVTCGVTFTFGGMRINNETEVQSVTGRSIPGLYAAGECVGGLFYFNYPGGTGLTSGAVFGRRAGAGAAAFSKRNA